MVKSKNFRVDKEFENQMREIRNARIIKGVDIEPKSYRRLTKAMTRSSLWNPLKNVLINSQIEDDKNKRGRVKKKK